MADQSGKPDSRAKNGGHGALSRRPIGSDCRFEYKPNRIPLKRGEPVVLEITSLDFVHGFNVPDLKIRADLPPGQITKVRLVFDRAGEYDFLCDNFCGSGQEEMGGKIIVSAW